MFSGRRRNGEPKEFMRTLSGVAALSIPQIEPLSRVSFLRMATAMPDSNPHDRLQPEWYRRKVAQVQEKMKNRKLNALLLLDATNIIYTVGYFHLSTERPLAALIPESGDPVMFVPGLETDQVKTWWVKDYEAYFDYPGQANRVRWIFEHVAKRGSIVRASKPRLATRSKIQRTRFTGPG